MNENKNKSNGIWITVLVSALVALVVSALVCLGFTLVPWLLAKRTVSVPSIVGLQLDEARERTARYRFEIVSWGEESSKLEEGAIVSQEPEPGTKIHPGSTIRVKISRGIPLVKLPDLAGFELSQATGALQTEGFFVSDVVSQHDTMPEDKIIATEPPAGVFLEKGSRVRLIVSLGQKQAEVPKVTGRKLTQAKQVIEDSGFTVGDIRTQVTTEYYQGTVMRQTPKAGELAPVGSKVDLIVAGVLR